MQLHTGLELPRRAIGSRDVVGLEEEPVGGSIHFETAGSGPPVLMIQGVGVAGRGWTPQVATLKNAFELAWFDNPGLGRSAGPPGDLARMVDAALEVLDACGWASAHIVGHSLGGVIAQKLALDHPQRVRSLALLCTFAKGSATLSFSPESMWRQLRMALGTRASRRRAFYEFVSPRKPTERAMSRLEDVFGRSLADLPSVARAQVRVLLKADHREALSALRKPTVVIGGLHDRVAPIAQTRLLAQLLRCRHHELDGGHALTVEMAAQVNTLLRLFWQAA